MSANEKEKSLHDLQAPLAKIRSLSTLMQEASSLEEIKEDYLPLLVSSLKQMEEAIKKIS